LLVLLFSVPPFAFQSVSRTPVASSTEWDESYSVKLKQQFKEAATAALSRGSSARRTLGKGGAGRILAATAADSRAGGTRVAD